MSEKSDQLCALLYSHRFQFANEKDLQQGIELVLSKDYKLEREFILGPSDRIDFFLEGIGIEVKVGGGLTALTRQLWRYAHIETITELILVTTKRQHITLPEEINGKPLKIVHLLNSVF